MRDLNIVKNFKREINLRTKVIKDKTKYSRKEKHKGQIMFVYMVKTDRKVKCFQKLKDAKEFIKNTKYTEEMFNGDKYTYEPIKTKLINSKQSYLED